MLYSLVGIGWYFGWYYCVCVAYFSKMARTFFKRFCGTLFLKKSLGSHSKRGPSLPFEEKWGSCQICNTKKYQPGFPLVLVGMIPTKYQPIPTEIPTPVYNSSEETRLTTSARLLFPVFEQDFFREIQESVGFLRNPQDFKNSCRKTKKCSCF